MLLKGNDRYLKITLKMNLVVIAMKYTMMPIMKIKIKKS